jgi:hypothetical protein
MRHIPRVGDFIVADPERREHHGGVSPVASHRWIWITRPIALRRNHVRQRISSMSGAFLLLILFSPDAGAATLKIRPDQLLPVTSTDSYSALPAVGFSPATLQTTLTLPVGKTIKKLTVYARASSPGGGGEANVALRRVKMGTSPEVLAHAMFEAVGETGIEVVTSTDIDSPIVASGYTYFLVVSLFGSGTELYGVQLTYQ